MKFFSDIRLLLLSIWIGSAVFFIGVAQSAFAVLPTRDLAGQIVGRNLTYLDFGGIAIAGVLILTSFVAGNANRVWLWVERFLLLTLGASCAVGQFVFGFWLASIRSQLGRPIDEVATDDPLRLQFNALHEWSTWAMFAGLIAALLAFFIIANRRFTAAKEKGTDPYDFSKEFKV